MLDSVQSSESKMSLTNQHLIFISLEDRLQLDQTKLGFLCLCFQSVRPIDQSPVRKGVDRNKAAAQGNARRSPNALKSHYSASQQAKNMRENFFANRKFQTRNALADLPLNVKSFSYEAGFKMVQLSKCMSNMYYVASVARRFLHSTLHTANGICWEAPF